MMKEICIYSFGVNYPLCIIHSTMHEYGSSEDAIINVGAIINFLKKKRYPGEVFLCGNTWVAIHGDSVIKGRTYKSFLTNLFNN